ncbi:MAG: GGDEF domain-containing protein [Rhodospirillales bacterium]|nr:MAG: GGDEF domain-containing protein [Rhodospirillales bacterium]
MRKDRGTIVRIQIDASGAIVEWPAAAGRITGIVPRVAIGRQLGSLLIDADLATALGQARDRPVETVLVFDLGKRGRLPVEAAIFGAPGRAGAAAGYEVRIPVPAEPASARIGLADASAAAYPELRRLEMPESAALLIDAQRLRIVEANRAAARAFGRRPSELKGRILPRILNLERNRARHVDCDDAASFGYLRLVDRDGAAKFYGASVVPLRNAGRDLALCVLHDLTTCLDALSGLSAANEELSRLARHDHLTGLFNKAMFQDTLGLANARVGRSGGLLGVLYIDLDGFKPVNDQYGHDVGDALLTEVVQRMQSGLRASDVMARLGGDEFGAILENLRDRNDALRVATNLIDRLAAPFEMVGGRRVKVSASIGAVVTDRTVEDAAELVVQADRAMYQAKSLGRGRAALAPA